MNEDGYLPMFLEKSWGEAATEDFLSFYEALLAYSEPEFCKSQDPNQSDFWYQWKQEGKRLLPSGAFHSVNDTLVNKKGSFWVEEKDGIGGSTNSVDFMHRRNSRAEWWLTEKRDACRWKNVGLSQAQCKSPEYLRSDGVWGRTTEQSSWEDSNESFMTLPLCILEFMRNVGRPVSEEEILEEARKKYSILRKWDGSRYKENQIRAVKGSLCSTGIFKKAEDSGKEWVVNEEAAKQYEAKMAQKHASLWRKGHGCGVKKGGGGGGWQKRRLGQRDHRPGDEKAAIPWIPDDDDDCSLREREETACCAQWRWIASISNEMRNNPRWFKCFDNPFAGSRPFCSLKELEDALGTEKLMLVMQTFHWLTNQLPQRMCPISPSSSKTKRRPSLLFSTN